MSAKPSKRERRHKRLVTERVQYRQMLDALPDPVVVTNADKEIIAHNSRASYLLFTAPDDSAGRRRAVSINNELFAQFLERGLLIADAAGTPRELSLADPVDGRDLLFEVLTSPMGQGPQAGSAMVSVLHDVTDLRRAAAALASQVQRATRAEAEATAERDRLNLILEHVADPILVTDPAANAILMNRQAEELFHSAAPASARAVDPRGGLAVGRNDTKVTSLISEFALTDEAVHRERLMLTDPESNAERPVEAVSGKIFDAPGEPIAIVSVFHDLRSQVENERLYEALKALNSELEGRVVAATQDLADRNARLQWQSEELTRANKLKTDFLASMSHELRTPLNGIIGYASLLLEGVTGAISPEQRQFLERARAAGQHLLTLINDLLDLTRIDAGKMPVRIEAVPLRPLIAEVVQQIEPMVRTKALTFVLDEELGDLVVHTDKTKVKQILLNLLSNAVKFTSEGQIRLTVRPFADRCQFEISDTGIGIKPEDIGAVWEDFKQLDSSKTRVAGGTGLGLSITKRLVTRLSGTVTLRSTFGQGTTFCVDLPRRLDG